jgi:hypothetical protein
MIYGPFFNIKFEGGKKTSTYGQLPKENVRLDQFSGK